MDDFLPLPQKYVGYPLMLGEACQRLHKDRWALRDLLLLPDSEREADRRQAQMYLWAKLASSELHAFAQARASGNWYRIPPGYWLDHRKGIDGWAVQVMFDEIPAVVAPASYLDSIPDDLIGQPIVIWREDLDQHLAQMPCVADAILASTQNVAGAALRDATGANLDDGEISPSEASTGEASEAGPSKDRNEECARVAAELDGRKILVRDVRASDVDEIWDKRVGRQPNVQSITQFMRGGRGGRPRKDGR